MIYFITSEILEQNFLHRILVHNNKILGVYTCIPLIYPPIHILPQCLPLHPKLPIQISKSSLHRISKRANLRLQAPKHHIIRHPLLLHVLRQVAQAPQDPPRRRLRVKVKARPRPRHQHRTLDLMQQLAAPRFRKRVVQHPADDLRVGCPPHRPAHVVKLPPRLERPSRDGTDHAVKHPVGEVPAAEEPPQPRGHAALREGLHGVEPVDANARTDPRVQCPPQRVVPAHRGARDPDVLEVEVVLRVSAAELPQVIEDAAHDDLPVRAHGQLVSPEDDALARAVKGEDRVAETRADGGVDEVDLFLGGVPAAGVDQDRGLLAAWETLVCGREIEVAREGDVVFVGDVEEVHVAVEVLGAAAEVVDGALDGREDALVVADGAFVEHELRCAQVVRCAQVRPSRGDAVAGAFGLLGDLLDFGADFDPVGVPAFWVLVFDFGGGVEDFCDLAALEGGHGEETQKLELEEGGLEELEHCGGRGSDCVWND